MQSNAHKPEKILESKVDAEEWKMELERVLPQLKVTVQAGTMLIKLFIEFLIS